jgi:hypothetical protein
VLAINATTGAVSVIVPLDFKTTRSIRTSVIATDGGQLSCQGTLDLHVQDVNEPPQVNSATFWVLESARIGETLSLSADGRRTGDGVARVTFWDPENDTITLTQLSASGVFSISQSDGTVRLASALDFKRVASYDVVVSAADKGPPRPAPSCGSSCSM